MSRSLSKVRSQYLPRRGLSREEAAVYLGISPTKFDELRKMGTVQPPRLIGDRKLWDIRELDLAFDVLPRENQEGKDISWFEDE